ncbi:MAG: DNA recombination protein RmuC [Pseudomonadota bacterium]
MKPLIQIGQTSLDVFHISAFAILLLLSGFALWLWLERQQLIQATARQSEDLADLAYEKTQFTEQLEAARNTLQATQIELAQLQGQTDKQREDFAELASNVLDRVNRQFLERADETFKKHREGAEGELKQLIKPIGENFDAFKKRVDAIEKVRAEDKSAIREQMHQIHQSLTRSTAETGKLVNALTAPKGGGKWGEMTLRNVMEHAGLSGHCDFSEQVSDTTEQGRQRPDAVIYLPGGRQIVVDSKVSLDAYMKASSEGDPTQRSVHLKAHADSVRRHVEALSSKRYQDNLDERVDFVAMFIPGENFFAAALEHAPDLLERAYAKGVIITTPSTLIGLAKTVAYVWRQEKMAENAREAAKLGQELYERIGTMAGHIDRLGKSLNGAVDNYNKMNASLDKRVLPTMRKFEELSIAPPDKPMAEPKAIDSRADPGTTLQLDLIDKGS